MIDAQLQIDFGQDTKPLDTQEWLRPANYPIDAAKRKQQGDVIVRFNIASNGGASNCAVAKSSGHRSLDAVPCRILGRSARFEPARGLDGVAIATKGEMIVRFRITG